MHFAPGMGVLQRRDVHPVSRLEPFLKSEISQVWEHVMLQILILSLERTHGFRQYISRILMSGDRRLSVLTERGGGGQAGSFIGRLSFSSNKKFQQLLHPAHLTSCNI